MKSKVYFIDLRAGFKESFIDKVARLIKSAGLPDVVRKRDLVAVKTAFRRTWKYGIHPPGIGWKNRRLNQGTGRQSLFDRCKHPLRRHKK